jgi:uncharacterized membrane protein
MIGTHLIENFYAMTCILALVTIVSLALVLLLGNMIFDALFPEKKDNDHLNRHL